ncbi:MAG: PASTA domain-containing protein, partial [Planctomycetes bacterium]|nr:PASTA domain-containing protein [Planctomycetota bacterium]
DTVPAGDVISQNPAGGASVMPGTTVDIVVSLGVQMVTVPNVVGQAQATAQSNIVAASLVVGTVTTSYSPTVPVGDVISQNPAGGASVAIGSSVDIVVSLGVQPVTVPNVVGQVQATAEANIVAAGLVASATTAYSDTVPAGDVISQNPAGGASVAPGTTVDIVVSLGVQMVTVPDVVDLAQATAESNIVSAGLAVGTVTTEVNGSVPAGDVISQNPAGGSSVAIGSSVDLVVSLGASTPQSQTIVVTDGWDSKNDKSFSDDGKVYIFTSSDDQRWDLEKGGYWSSFEFSNISFGAGAAITSVTVYCEHQEESGFGSGNIEWNVGTNWPNSPTTWGTDTSIPNHTDDVTDSWDVTSYVNSTTRVNDLEFRIKNNDNDKKIKPDYIYVVVEWTE